LTAFALAVEVGDGGRFTGSTIGFYLVKGQWELPTGGHETCPLTATRTAR
jgi:hypothetical protein